MLSLVADIRFACRLLRKTPGFSMAVLAVLALGIGANAALFSTLDQTVIRRLPYAEPDRLAMVFEDFSAFGTAKARVSPARSSTGGAAPGHSRGWRRCDWPA